MRKSCLVCIFFYLPIVIFCQNADTSKINILKEIQITHIRTIHGIGHMPSLKDGVIYNGKKTEVIIIDSINANKAINNTRQILGRIPGLVIVETESGGFTSNGIATRGLNPSQSIEMNTRQNGYNISADIYGYNEAYYLPPMEAVSRIEMVRGAASLQFGPQFGGMVNYIINEAPRHKKFEYKTSETFGSYNLFNLFQSVSGTSKEWNYYSFVQCRSLKGWRENSDQLQVTAFGKIEYVPNHKMKAGLEYSLLRNRIHMPGGLSDSLFKLSPQSSLRARNWLKSPWNIIAFHFQNSLSSNTSIYINSTYLFSNRQLVWRNEEGGPQALDTIDRASGDYIPREVEKEFMNSLSTEARLAHQYKIAKIPSTISGGIRLTHSWFIREQGGQGSTGMDFDLNIKGEYQTNLKYITNNVAPFAENIFQITPRFTITPGVRIEYLANIAKGYITDGDQMNYYDSKKRYIILFGIGSELKTGAYEGFYANFSQAYRPVDYSQLTPIGVSSKIDPHLKDAFGYNSDLGFRGLFNNFLNYDISIFYLKYNNRIGTLLLKDYNGNEYTYRTNIANSIHKGIEAYIEFDFIRYLNPASAKSLSIFNSFGFTNARYISGPYKGNRVEASVNIVNRTGVTFRNVKFSATVQMNNTGDSYGDASNVNKSSNPVAGYIPAYTVFDLSGSYKLGAISIKAGINNILNRYYFTRRTDEYPGPGILPSPARSFYLGCVSDF